MIFGKKTRAIDRGEHPYAVFESGNWTWKVLKSWQNDNTKPYARWFCLVLTPMTGSGGDMGDTYVHDILCTGRARLVAVDGREPTDEERATVEEWRANAPVPTW